MRRRNWHTSLKGKAERGGRDKESKKIKKKTNKEKEKGEGQSVFHISRSYFN